MTDRAQVESAAQVAMSRLGSLRQRAYEDPRGGRAAVWQWLLELRDVAKSSTSDAETILNRLFELGTAPEGLDGSTEGMLVATTTNWAIDGAVSALTSAWMPWRGKRFDVATASGDNRMTSSSSVVSRVLWPLYSMRSGEDGRSAFDFDTYFGPGKENPDREVLVIDYASIPDNPAMIIRSIRDELIELVPGAYLGKIFFKMPTLSGHQRYERIGYFALQSA